MLQTQISDLVTKAKRKENIFSEKIKRKKKKLQKSRIVGFRKNNTKEERETYSDLRNFRMINF